MQHLAEQLAQVATYYSMYMSTVLLDLDLSPDTLCSGWMCTALLLSLYPLRAGHGRSDLPGVIGRVLAYVALYLLVDHYLDSPSIPLNDKEDILRWLHDPVESQCVRKTRILSLIDELDGRCDAPTLARMVTESYRAQTRDDLSFKQYLHACRDKGGVTVVIGVRLTVGRLRGVSDGDLHRLGYCIQLLDDVSDCSQDSRDSIHTACTHARAVHGCVDSVVWRLLYECTRLPRALRYHTTALRCGTVHVCARTGNVSGLLRRVLDIGDRKLQEKCLRLRAEAMMRNASM